MRVLLFHDMKWRCSYYYDGNMPNGGSDDMCVGNDDTSWDSRLLASFVFITSSYLLSLLYWATYTLVSRFSVIVYITWVEYRYRYMHIKEPEHRHRHRHQHHHMQASTYKLLFILINNICLRAKISMVKSHRSSSSSFMWFTNTVHITLMMMVV